eukprot:g12562.t1
MDEVFHVPQAQAYCNGDFGHWDPKITTPPGLYLSAVAYSRIVRSAKAMLQGLGWATARSSIAKERCVVGVLRHVNWVFSLGTLMVMRALLSRRMAPAKALAHALLLWLYPVSFFFSFLFYTDPGATFFALLCYLLATGRRRGGGWSRRIGSSLAGGVSVLFRQTNAVWVAFTLATCLLEDFTPLVYVPDAWKRSDHAPFPADAGEHASAPPAAESAATMSYGKGTPPSPRRLPWSTTRRRKTSWTLGSSGVPDTGTVEVTQEPPLDESKSVGNDSADDDGRINAAQLDRDRMPPFRLLLLLARAALEDAHRGAPFLRTRAPLAAPILLFAVFVWGVNEGAIVLGDKENHSPGGPPHLAQLAYLVAVTASLWGIVGGREAAFGPEARNGFARWARGRGVVVVAVIVAGVAAAMWRYSLDHPFLLSDNRHYPFYVWQRLLSRRYMRAGLAPAYVYCGWLVTSRLGREKPALWVLTYAGAAAVVLVPSPLMEPRYLTIPVLLAHLESAERSWESLLVGVVACAAVNAITVYVFLARPFAWHDGSLARFMW